LNLKLMKAMSKALEKGALPVIAEEGKEGY
jgi:hypothetical protein